MRSISRLPGMTMRPHALALGLGLLLAAPAAAQAPLTPIDSARHVLNRLGYGGTPGEVEAVARAGVMQWVDRQLGFDNVRDPLLAPVENGFDVLHTSISEMVAMQRDQQQKQQRAQALADTAARNQMIAELRRENQMAGRKGLQMLISQLDVLTMIRAVESERQLGEVLADFWTNHFNVYINKNQDRSLFADYLEHTIRAHALGKFEDLLIATAKSPAMLFYLDNVQSVAPGTDPRALAQGQRGRGGITIRPGISGRGGLGGRGVFPPMGRGNAYPPVMGNDSMQRQRALANAPRGLNENYARELMELHTLGVDGGYTQDDVINVAKILTGWSIDRQNGSYRFIDAAHDRDQKMVMGVKYPSGHGEEEGIRLLKQLATAPATMHHVSAQLCQRFVADEAPDGCIDDAVKAWQRSDGDIRSVVRAIVHSPDFWAPVNVQSKIKTPLEFVVTAVRAVNGVPDSTPRLAQNVARLGEPLFQKQTPDGYGEKQEDWVNSGALLARMNFAVGLASGRLPGVTVDLDRVVPLTDDHAALVAKVNQAIFAGAMTEHTRATIVKQLNGMNDPRQARALAVGLALGGPDFQRQ